MFYLLYYYSGADYVAPGKQLVKKKVNCREELEEEEEKEEEEEEEDWYSLDQMPITSHLLKSEWICSTQLEGKYANV
jgi:hypothetical protein